MTAYYNEIEPFAAQWLRNLIAAGHIAPGDVDERSIADVSPDDLRGYRQCHFFAGIGAWSYALRLAGWPDDRPVWTGSCPCQPFSAAGKGGGFDDERHLWPVWFKLIRERRPPVIFGEQVSSSAAIGPALGKGQNVQALRDREAVRRVLRELQRQSPMGLQGLRAGPRTVSEEIESRASRRGIQEMAGREPRPGLGCGGSASGEAAGHPLRSGPFGYSGEDRRRLVRDDGHPVRPDGAEGVERSLLGPDQSWHRVHDIECSGGAVRPECNGEHLGAEPDCGDRGGDHGAEAVEERSASDLLGGLLEEAPGRPWFDAVHVDLEDEGYAVGAADICAAGVGAPHIRQRLYFVADALPAGRTEGRPSAGDRSTPGSSGTGLLADAAITGRSAQSQWTTGEDGRPAPEPRRLRDARLVALAEHGGCEGRDATARYQARPSPRPASGGARLMGDPGGEGLAGRSMRSRDDGSERPAAERAGGDAGGPGDADSGGRAKGRPAAETVGHGLSVAADGRRRSPWADLEWLPCADGKARPTQPGLFPLAHGLAPDLGWMRPGEDSPFRTIVDPATGRSIGQAPWRIGMLRAYGNAIVAPLAAEFIGAYLDLRLTPEDIFA